MKTPTEWLEELNITPGINFTISHQHKDAFLTAIGRIQKDAYIQGGLDAIEKAQSITSEVFAKHKEAV